MIINPDVGDIRANVKLESGWLLYKKTAVYLGVLVSDSGVINVDLDLHVTDRSKSVYIKLANFMRNNNSHQLS